MFIHQNSITNTIGLRKTTQKDNCFGALNAISRNQDT